MYEAFDGYGKEKAQMQTFWSLHLRCIYMCVFLVIAYFSSRSP